MHKRFQPRVGAALAAGDDFPPAHTFSGAGSGTVIAPPHPPPRTSGSSNSRRRRQRRSVRLAAMADAVRVILAGLGEDVRRDGLLKTPSRVARAFDFAVEGYERPIAKVMTSALFPEEGVCEKAAASGSGDNAGYSPDSKHEWLSSRGDEIGVVFRGGEAACGGGGGHGGLVVVRDIHCFATCAGCLLPLRLRCHVGYVPACGRVVGLSKLARVAVLLARRLQTPDGIASALAGVVESALRPGGVAVVVEAQHLVGLEERTTGVVRACGGLEGWGSGERVTGPGGGLEEEGFDKDGGAMHTAGAGGGAGGAAAANAAAGGSACGRPVGKDEGGFRGSMRCSCTSLDELDAQGSADEWLDVGEESDSASAGDDGEVDEHFRGWARPGKRGHHMACSVSGMFAGGMASSGCGGLGVEEVGSSSNSSGSGSSSTTCSSNSGDSGSVCSSSSSSGSDNRSPAADVGGSGVGPELDEFLCLLGLEWVDCCERSSRFVKDNSSIRQGPCPLAVNCSTLSRLVPPSWGDDGQEEEGNDDTAGDTDSEEEEEEDEHGSCDEGSHISASAAAAAGAAAGAGEDSTRGPMKAEGVLDDVAVVKAPSAASVSKAAESLLGWCLAGRVRERKQTVAVAAGAMVAAEFRCNGALEQSGLKVVASRYLNYLLSATAGSLLPLQYIFSPGHLCQRSKCCLRAGVDDVAGGTASLPTVPAAGASGNDTADVARWLTGGGAGRGPACGVGGSRGGSSTQGMQMMLGVPMSSLCEHHLLPFFGHVHIAWVQLLASSPPSPSSASSSRSCSRSPSPSLSSSSSSGTDAVLVEAAACEAACEAAGEQQQQQQHQQQLSRAQIARAVQMYGRRPQVQERLTRQVAEAVEYLLKQQQQQQQHRHQHHPPCSLTMEEDDPRSVEQGDQDLSLREGGPRAGDLVVPLSARWGVMVVAEAEHLCMAVRGVEKPGAFTSTLATLGAFTTEPRLRAQFLLQVSRWRASLGANTGSGGW